VAERLQVPRGTYDMLPEDADARAALEATARRILEGAGYRRIETPTFEQTEVFARGVFRSEKPQQGRFRQFWQIGAEAIGSEDPAVDAELIVLLATLLAELEVGGARLRVGSLGTPAARHAYRERLQAHLRANADRLSEDVRSRIDLNPLRAFDSDHPGTRAVMADAPLLLHGLDAEDGEHFAAVRELLLRAGIEHEVDPTLVRGMDYYTRTVFEFTSDDLGAQSGVAGGGRYDGLVGMLGGPTTPGCGWAAGIERILLASEGLPVAPPPVDLYVGFDSPQQRAVAFAIVDEARRARMNAQLELGGRSRKGQLRHADRIGARYVAIVEDEATMLKDMQAGEQLAVDATGVVARILRQRGMP
jgi:histidyl-tRNA synthetase